MAVLEIVAVAAASAVMAQSCVTTTNQAGGAFYLAPLGVGTPPQVLQTIPDTGSYDLLLDSVFCRESDCRAHMQYSANQSSTSAMTSASADPPVNSPIIEATAYGQGAVQSVQWQDSISLAGPPLRSARTDMLLIVSSQLSGWSSPGSFDGIMGLGRRDSSASTASPQTALLTALNVTQFTMCLGPMNLPSSVGGRLELGAGGPLAAAFEDEFVDAGLYGDNSWVTPLTAASLSGGASASVPISLTQLCGSSGCPALIDSGTTLLTFPTAMQRGVLAGLETACPGCLTALQAQETCSGASFNSLPSLSLTLGGSVFELPPSVYMAPMDVELLYIVRAGPFTLPYTKAGVRCVPLFSSIDSSSNLGQMLILGMPFLRAYATRFTRTRAAGGARMEFARVSNVTAAACNACPAAAAAGRAGRGSVAAENAMLPASAAGLTAATAHSDSASSASVVMKLSDVRLPWWLVDPAARPVHVSGSASRNATAVAELAAGRSRWQVVL